MRKIYIKYDPYEMKTVVKVDGREIQNNKHCDANLKRFLNSDVHMPIQSWIDPIERDDWKGLLETICMMGDRDITVEFSGRRIDYESIQEALNAQNDNRGLGAKIMYCDLEDEIIPDSQMKANIEDVIELMLSQEFKDIVKGSNSPALIEKYKKLKLTYDEIEAEEFRIVFTGTYSSGKSSTINALIGKNILPTASGTCTAKICKIIHTDSKELSSFATVRYDYKGEKKVFICKDEVEVQERIKGAEETVDTIEVLTDLSSLYPKSVENGLNLVIVDTPGTDSATGNDTDRVEEEDKRLHKKSHLEITKEVLKSKQKDMVVLISHDKLEGDNIVELLDIIEESAEQDEGAFNDRFLFVMNMCDLLSYSNEGETLQKNVKNYIANIKKVPNSQRMRNIVNPRVFPISSGPALAIVNGYTTEPSLSEESTNKDELYGYYWNFCRKIYHYKLEKLENGFETYIDAIKTQYRNYHNYCLEEQSSVSEAVKHSYIKKLSGELDISERIMIHSGIPALASAIQDYIRNYAYPIKVRQLLNCFKDIIVELNSLNEVKMEALEQAKKDYSDAVSKRERTEAEELEVEKGRVLLENIKERMVVVKRKIDGISETIPEINNIQSSFYVIKNSIATKVNGRKEVLKAEGDEIIQDISSKIDVLLGQISDTVNLVKKKKRGATVDLYQEFVSYLLELETAGLMDIGNFSLKDTVEYHDLVDKEKFTEPVSNTRDEANTKKEHIEFGYGIRNFFDSIGRAWKTRKEPNTVRNTYIDIAKYISDNIDPIEVDIDKYVEKLRSDYQSDIKELKKDSKERVDRVVFMIQEKNTEISKIRKNASKIAKDEKGYAKEVKKLEGIRKYLDILISKIPYTQI